MAIRSQPSIYLSGLGWLVPLLSGTPAVIGLLEARMARWVSSRVPITQPRRLLRPDDASSGKERLFQKAFVTTTRSRWLRRVGLDFWVRRRARTSCLRSAFRMKSSRFTYIACFWNLYWRRNVCVCSLGSYSYSGSLYRRVQLLALLTEIRLVYRTATNKNVQCKKRKYSQRRMFSLLPEVYMSASCTD